MELALAEYLSHAPVYVRFDDGEIVYWTKGCEELYGYTFDEVRGRRSHELLKTEFPEPLERIEALLCRDGEWRGRLRHTCKNGSVIWVESLWRRRFGAAYARPIVVEQNTDVTERVEIERQREILTLELDHRVKNILAVVQGLARFSFGEADRTHVRQFEERLRALAEAHAVLTREHWRSAGLKDLLGEIIHAMRLEGRVQFTGPDVVLAPSSAIAYALAFHELATNALKHGALSQPKGRVEVRWSLEGQAKERLHLVWTESDGPAVEPPSRSGFGSRLIKRAVAHELGAAVRFDYRPSGLVCEFDGPIQKSPPTPTSRAAAE